MAIVVTISLISTSVVGGMIVGCRWYRQRQQRKRGRGRGRRRTSMNSVTSRELVVWNGMTETESSLLERVAILATLLRTCADVRIAQVLRTGYVIFLAQQRPVIMSLGGDEVPLLLLECKS